MNSAKTFDDYFERVENHRDKN